MNTNKTDKTSFLDLSNSNLESEQALTTEESKEDSQIKAYVEEFKKEVEKKFQKSNTNVEYRFPLYQLSDKKPKKEQPDSFDSLKRVNHYDLESQNIKKELMETLKTNKLSESDILVEAIKKMGKLDSKYLKSQFSNVKSPFFKIIANAIDKKLTKEGHKRKEADYTELSDRVTRHDFKINNNLIFHKSFNRAKDCQSESMKKIKVGLNSTRNLKRDTKVDELKKMKKEREGQKIKLNRNFVKKKLLNGSMSPRHRLESSLQAKRMNGSLKQRKMNKRETIDRSSLGKKKAGSISNKLKKKTVSKDKSGSQLNSTKNRKENKIVTNPKNIIKKHVTLTKDQLNSLIKKNLYNKTKNKVKSKTKLKKSCSNSITKHKIPSSRQTQKMFQYTTTRQKEEPSFKTQLLRIKSTKQNR